MKPFNKFALVALAVAACWGAYQEIFHEEEGDMEALLRKVDRAATCTKTDNLNGHTWLACRWGDGERDQGPVWIQVGEQDGRPLWTQANGKASQIAQRVESRLSPDDLKFMPRIRPREPGEDLPGIVPWDQFN